MKAYVQYYTRRVLTGKLHEALASDGYRPLDARLNLLNMIAEARRPNFRGYEYFQIRRGDFKHHRTIYSNM